LGERLSQQAHDRHRLNVNRNTIQDAIALIADVIFHHDMGIYRKLGHGCLFAQIPYDRKGRPLLPMRGFNLSLIS